MRRVSVVGLSCVLYGFLCVETRAAILLGELTQQFSAPASSIDNHVSLGYQMPGTTGGYWLIQTPALQYPFPFNSMQSFTIPLTGADTPAPGSDGAEVLTRLTDGVQDVLWLRLVGGGQGGGDLGQVEGIHPLGSGWRLGNPDLVGNQVEWMSVSVNGTGYVDWQIWGSPVPTPATALALNLAWPLLMRRRRRVASF
jgi:hypothetical protein